MEGFEPSALRESAANTRYKLAALPDWATCHWYCQKESNPHRGDRSSPFCPLNYSSVNFHIMPGQKFLESCCVTIASLEVILYLRPNHRGYYTRGCFDVEKQKLVRDRGIELRSPVWKTGIIAIILIPHLIVPIGVEQIYSNNLQACYRYTNRDIFGATMRTCAPLSGLQDRHIATYALVAYLKEDGLAITSIQYIVTAPYIELTISNRSVMSLSYIHPHARG